MELIDLRTSDIIDNALQQLNAFTNITYLSPGSKARMLIDILSEELGLQASQFDAYTGAGLLRNAQGNVLDYIGEIYGLERLQEIKSEVTSSEQNFYLYTIENNFGTINNGRDIVVPAGKMIISNTQNVTNTSILYTNTDQVVLKNTENKVFINVEAITMGAAANAGSNTLVYHNFTNYSDSLNRTLLVTNSQSVTYGRDRESDDNYRYRIQKEKISSEAGNDTAIRLAILVVPGIANVIQIPFSRGIGTCDWLVSSTSTLVSEDLLILIQEVINEKQAVGMSNLAKSPTLIGTEFVFSVTFKGSLEDRQKEGVISEIKKNVADYINNLKIGESLILDQVVRIVLSTSDLIESMGDDDSADNFKNIFIYKRSQASNAVTRKSLTANYVPKIYERIVLEPSIPRPITIIENN